MNATRAGVFLGLALFVLPASASAERKLKVLTSFLPVYVFTVNVAGEFATVESFSTLNASPHDFQFLPGDAQKVSDADLIVINGLGVELESKLQPLLKSAGKTRKQVAMSAGLDAALISDQGDHGSHAHGTTNPHIWLDPVLAAHCVTNILRAFQSADPGHSAQYAANASNYVARLQALHREIERGLAFAKGAPMVTHHNAFEYFARRYGLRVVGVVEEVAEVAPGPRYLAHLRHTIQSEHVPVIFAEANHSLKVVRQLAADAGVRMAVLDTLESGKPAAGAYEEGMRANLEILKKELAAYAPSRTP